MNGTMIVLSPEGERTERELTAPAGLEELQAAVGGYIEHVPFFDRLAHSTGLRKCVVYCNEMGKLDDLPLNAEANRLWRLSARSAELSDYLVGPVVILFGDEAFMEAL